MMPALQDEIINYDASKITLAMRTAVQRVLDEKGNSFEPAVIAR